MVRGFIVLERGLGEGGGESEESLAAAWEAATD